MRDDDAHHLGKSLSRNRSLERLLIDRTTLMVQQLARGERLSLNGVDFSEVDATLMAQLLQQNLVLSCIDLSGSKSLQRETKVLSDAFSRCKFPLRELSVSGRLLGLEGSASLLDALKDCPLEVLDLTGNDICGVKSTGTDPFNPYVLKMVCALVRRESGGLRRLRLKGNHLIGNDLYTNEAVLLISEALRSPLCRLEELQLGLVNKGSGLREEDGLVLGTAVQARALPHPTPPNTHTATTFRPSPSSPRRPTLELHCPPLGVDPCPLLGVHDPGQALGDAR